MSVIKPISPSAANIAEIQKRVDNPAKDMLFNGLYALLFLLKISYKIQRSFLGIARGKAHFSLTYNMLKLKY